MCVNDIGVAVRSRLRPGGGGDRADSRRRGRALAAPIDARTRTGAEALVGEVETWSGRLPAVLVHAAGTLGNAMVHKATDGDSSAAGPAPDRCASAGTHFLGPARLPRQTRALAPRSTRLLIRRSASAPPRAQKPSSHT